MPSDRAAAGPDVGDDAVTTELAGAAYPPLDRPAPPAPVPAPPPLPGAAPASPWAPPSEPGPSPAPPASLAGSLPGRSPFSPADPIGPAGPGPAGVAPGGVAPAGPPRFAAPVAPPAPVAGSPARPPAGWVPAGAPGTTGPGGPGAGQAGPGATGTAPGPGAAAPPGAVGRPDPGVPGWAPLSPGLAPPPAWWTRDPGSPPRPPEYDARQWGPLGAGGGFPTGPAAPAAQPPVRRGGASAVLIGVVSAVIASLITATVVVAVTDRDGDAPVARGPSPTLVAPLDIYGLLEKAQPSVVSIRTDFASTSGSTPIGAGSGVIISEDGLVLTNAHVISGASTMSVTLYDGHEKAATLVGSFPDDDIALIRIEDPGTVVPAELGSSDDIVVGDPVVAIGNALNLGGPPSVTEGIVSAKDRNIQTAEGTLTNLIQTDAAINPGNSGGPLLDAQGQVVGINTAIIDDAQNIGFAISIDVLKPLIEELKEGRGTITPDSPFLGVSTQTLSDVTDAVLERYGVTADEGAFISDVVPDTAAAEAGLQPGDVIIAIDGQAVTSSTDVGAVIRTVEPGQTITLEIERQGVRETVQATVKSRAESGN